MRTRTLTSVIMLGAVLASAVAGTPVLASSHMDAPLITYDDPANTTDVYAFVSGNGDGANQRLTTALAVYPFEEPGIGPNNYSFDPRVRYEIHVALGDDIAAGRKTISYGFAFETNYETEDTILQAYLGEVDVLGGQFEGQNLMQSYTVTKTDHRTGQQQVLGAGVVPPNNQGLVTPLYNQNDDGDMPAKGGVTNRGQLDAYTKAAIERLDLGYDVFAGQRDDGFYADIQSIFDLDFSFGRAFFSPTKPFDSQGGFNVHTIVLDIPLDELDGATTAGVYATTSRMVETADGPVWRQVGRQGNPLFAEALIAIRDKDLYNETEPTVDEAEFAEFAEDPEVSRVLGVTEIIPGLIRSIYIPDMIRVDLTTGPARLAGEEGFDRLGVFGGDALTNAAGETVFGGWPNGRRFGDDVVDIALIALGAAGPADFDQPGFGFTEVDIDGVIENDITFNDVFPYAATPLNGRNHGHHGAIDGVTAGF